MYMYMYVHHITACTYMYMYMCASHNCMYIHVRTYTYILFSIAVIPPSPDSPVKFSLSTLKCIRENTLRGGIHTLTFFLSDGKELPTLHFHDGGTSGLLQTLTRYLYLVRYITM